MAQDVRIPNCPTGTSEAIAACREQQVPGVERLLERLPDGPRQLCNPPDEEKPKEEPPNDTPRPLSIYERLREQDPRAEPLDGPAGEVDPGAPSAAENGWAPENNSVGPSPIPSSLVQAEPSAT